MCIPLNGFEMKPVAQSGNKSNPTENLHAMVYHRWKNLKEILIFSTWKMGMNQNCLSLCVTLGFSAKELWSWPSADSFCSVKAGGELGPELSVFAQHLTGERKAGKPRRCLLCGLWLFWRKNIWGSSLGPLCGLKIVYSVLFDQLMKSNACLSIL